VSIENYFDLAGKVAVITGGSRGLGLQIAEGFVAVGANVLIVARREEELQQAKSKLERDQSTVCALACNLTDKSAPKLIADTAEAIFGTVDILVNNAGTSWAEPMSSHPNDAWEKVLDLNVSSAFRLTKEIGNRFMIPERRGKIINIASIGGLNGNRPDYEMYTIGYNTSKGALINFTRALASEWGQYNINVNSLSPGFFPSQMSALLIERIGAMHVAATPLGRLGGENDLVGPALFLASEASRHVTGQNIVVDGGLTACS